MRYVKHRDEHHQLIFFTLQANGIMTRWVVGHVTDDPELHTMPDGRAWDKTKTLCDILSHDLPSWSLRNFHEGDPLLLKIAT